MMSTAGGKTRILRELMGFLWKVKLWWMIPIVGILILLGVLIALGEGAGWLAPFIYPFF